MALQDLGNVKGAKGDTGATGAAATVNVGTTSTGSPGTNATVTNSGTSSAATFNFTIPRGANGREFGAMSSVTGNVTTANGTETTLATTSALPAGNYVVIACATFQSTSATGTRIVKISRSDGYESRAIEIDGNGNGYTQIEVVDIVGVPANSTLSAKVQQNSGSNISVSGLLRYIQIS